MIGWELGGENEHLSQDATLWGMGGMFLNWDFFTEYSVFIPVPLSRNHSRGFSCKRVKRKIKNRPRIIPRPLTKSPTGNNTPDINVSLQSVLSSRPGVCGSALNAPESVLEAIGCVGDHKWEEYILSMLSLPSSSDHQIPRLSILPTQIPRF